MSENKKTPVYLRIKQDILRRISSGAYSAGDRLPSERELSEIYQTSRVTVRAAIEELIKEGRVIRRRFFRHIYKRREFQLSDK